MPRMNVTEAERTMLLEARVRTAETTGWNNAVDASLLIISNQFQGDPPLRKKLEAELSALKKA